MIAPGPSPDSSARASSPGRGLAARAPYPPVIDRMNAERADNLHSTSPRVDPPHVVQQGGGAARRGRHGPRPSLSAVGAAPAVAQRKLDLGGFQASKGPIQREISHDTSNIVGNKGRAGLVEVENLRGKELGKGANSPSVEPIGWNELRSAGHTLANKQLNNSHYNAVRMHLWNGRLGGPGGDVLNLAPGPAQVNSAMSAGPETGAKNLVEAGHAIWLSTRVTYQSDTVNASDFSSVIPNHIHMEFGPMVSSSGGLVRGTGSSWDTDIDQPAGALTGVKQKQYTNVTSETALLSLLLPASKQEKAQAYGLVQDHLKPALLLHHSNVYLGLGDPERTAALRAMTTLQVNMLIGNLGLDTNVRGLIDHILEYLEDPQLSNVFGQLGTAQEAVATHRRGAILERLGQTGKDFARSHAAVFWLYQPHGPAGALNDQYAILGMMTPGEIQALLSDRVDVELFDGWALALGATSIEERVSRIRGRVPEEMANRYDVSQEWARRKRAADANLESEDYPQTRSKAKKPKLS